MFFFEIKTVFLKKIFCISHKYFAARRSEPYLRSSDLWVLSFFGKTYTIWKHFSWNLILHEFKNFQRRQSSEFKQNSTFNFEKKNC